MKSGWLTVLYLQKKNTVYMNNLKYEKNFQGMDVVSGCFYIKFKQNMIGRKDRQHYCNFSSSSSEWKWCKSLPLICNAMQC